MKLDKNITMIICSILFIIAAITIYQSNKKYESNLYDAIRPGIILQGYNILGMSTKFPVKLENELSKDTCIIITTIEDLYSICNLRPSKNRSDIFIEYVYETLNNNNYFYTDSTTFAEIIKDKSSIVVKDKKIDSIYQKEGITGVLDRYLDSDDWLEKHYWEDKYGENAKESIFHGKNVNINYIIYLAAKNDIYFIYLYYCGGLEDEYMGYYRTDDIKKYKLE